MHTAFSSPSSAPAAPLMPVSDTVQERFIRLPEVMHLCGLSRSTIYDLRGSPMHTAFSSPSSAPAAPLMPVSDAAQERFIRLPEVMHL
ncbi:helix-turn-helix transcriptional regulator, partial [Klebsiella pneumoniae]|uniref:helix-turn-helix transcriptional regulator n=1 Tax=Klebsiella pneumoniae TaxID=573 RepID=UPI001D0D7692